MPAEYSAGAIIFKKAEDLTLYLILHYEEGHWGSAKGHIEGREAIEETACREIREETGLTDIRFIEGFQAENQYFFNSQDRRIHKTVTFLLAQTWTSEIRISDEHTEYVWLPYAEALEKITFQNEKTVLEKAHDFLNQKDRQGIVK